MQPTITLLGAGTITFMIFAMTLIPANANENRQPDNKGFAESLNGLKVYYEIFGQGDPIVVLAGGLMPIRTMNQVIDPLSKKRMVIAIDLEGHGQTGLRETLMSHERNGEDIAAVLAHLKIPKADIAGYSHGGDAAIWATIRHPKMVRNLIVIATAFAKSGWYPDAQRGMEGVNSSIADQLKSTPMFEGYRHPADFPKFLDRMGELMRKDWNWKEQIEAIETPTLLIFADHDSISMQHIAEFFSLFGGGVQEPGVMDTKYSQARLAIIPGYSHYNLGQAPELAQIIDRYLTRPTSSATMFTP